MLCSKCNKNMAVVYVTKMEGQRQTNQGLCLSCAKKMGITPLEQLMSKMGVNEEQLDEMNTQMNNFLINSDADSVEDVTGDKNPLEFINKIFEGTSIEGQEDKSSKNAKTKTTQNKQNKKKKFLDNYGINLIDKAKNGLIDTIIGRENEIDRTIQILNRRTKNNPVLIGEPGVGKTAIAEGLAVRITEKNVPAKLQNYEIYLLDFTSIVAGTQFRGQFEARLKGIIEEAKELGNIILVIDELHNIVGAGEAEGAMSAANILKPALAKGEIQVIGATTINEFRKYIEKDSALERRFQSVFIDEPTVEESIEILKGIKGYYEVYHNVRISDEIITEAVVMSERYISDRFLPDKAIDVIDEAGSKVNLNNTELSKLAVLKSELKMIQEQKENAISEDSIEEYQKAAEYKIKECKLIQKIKELEDNMEDVFISIEDIASVIESWTKIPVQSISKHESDKLIHLEERLHNRIISQNHAVSSVSSAIRRNRAGLKRKKRPVSFIFVGPTGVGKTELVKALADELFGNEDSIIRLDMSEYMEKHSVSKIIGAPPGYIGYDEQGQLTEKVRRKPYSVILLDEIEKAHSDIFNILLQVLEDGRITDSHGKSISFENTIIIMTSNAGSDINSGSYGFLNKGDQSHLSKAKDAVKDIFRPEFINRIDDIIVFEDLKETDIIKIIELMLSELEGDLDEKGIKIEFSDQTKKYILQNAYSTKYGARPIRRFIQSKIEDKLADMYIKGELTATDSFFVDTKEDNINIIKRQFKYGFIK